MKAIFFSIAFCLAFISNAQNLFDRNSNSVLVARKQNRIVYFKMGTPVRILFKNEQGRYQMIKGYFNHIKNDSFIIESFAKKDIAAESSIAPNAIEKIRILSRRSRKTAAIIFSAGAAYAGVMGIISKPGPLQYVLFIPAMGAALFFTYFYPATFLFDLAREKSKKNGWHFYLDKK